MFVESEKFDLSKMILKDSSPMGIDLSLTLKGSLIFSSNN